MLTRNLLQNLPYVKRVMVLRAIADYRQATIQSWTPRRRLSGAGNLQHLEASRYRTEAHSVNALKPRAISRFDYAATLSMLRNITAVTHDLV